MLGLRDCLNAVQPLAYHSSRDTRIPTTALGISARAGESVFFAPEGGVKVMGRRTYFEETHIFTGGLTSTLPI